jgi:hypothetical protein
LLQLQTESGHSAAESKWPKAVIQVEYHQCPELGHKLLYLADTLLGKFNVIHKLNLAGVKNPGSIILLKLSFSSR